MIPFSTNNSSSSSASNFTISISLGTTLYSELTDYIIFNAGVAVSLKDGNKAKELIVRPDHLKLQNWFLWSEKK